MLGVLFNAYTGNWVPEHYGRDAWYLLDVVWDQMGEVHQYGCVCSTGHHAVQIPLTRTDLVSPVLAGTFPPCMLCKRRRLSAVA